MTMETTSRQEALAADRVAVEAIRSRRVADAHFDYEQTNVADEILLSMKSYNPLHTAVIVDGPDGDSRLVLNTTVDEQRAFYGLRDTSNIVGADIFTSIGSEWYGFVHLVLTSKILATGELTQNDVIGLLPSTVDEDTIAGEMGWSRPAFMRPITDDPLPHDRVEAAKVHGRWLECVRAMDFDGLAALYAEDALCAVRSYPDDHHAAFRGRDELRTGFAELVAGSTIVDVDTVLRLTEDWYLMVELRWVVEDEAKVRWAYRTADVMVIDDDGKIRRHIGYGTDRLALTD